MKLVIDANVVVSALIADSKTRELIATLEPGLLTPAFVYDEIENYEDLIVENSGMKPDRVAQFSDLLFQYMDVVPADDFYPAIEEADEAIGDTDPDDVLYLTCAIVCDAAIWSNNSDFDEQGLVAVYSTGDVIDSHPREMTEADAERETAFEYFRESIERSDGVVPDTA